MPSAVFQFPSLIKATQFTLFQWLVKYYPMGKTSTESTFNLPGKIGWATMEAPGFIMLLYLMYALPKQEGIESLPFTNWTMAALFVSTSSLPRKHWHCAFPDQPCLLLLHSQDNPLHLPRPYITIGFESVDVTYPHFSLGFGARFPIDQRHVHWRLARRVRPYDAGRMDWRGIETRTRPDDLCSWSPGQHISRR